MTLPIVVCLLFLMAVAPILPWRHTSPGLFRTRLFWPAAAAVATLVLSVIGGVRGIDPLLAFGLGAFAGTSALRQLLIEIRRRGALGFTGPSGGGMVVHVGVVLIAVAFAASHSFAHTTSMQMNVGQTSSFDGHTFTYLGTENVATSTHTALAAVVKVDGGRAYTPAISNYPYAQEAIGTPSVRSTLTEDIYLMLPSPPAKPGGPAVIGVIVEPLVTWIWIGGGVMLGGTLLSAWPRRRRGTSSESSSSPVTVPASASDPPQVEQVGSLS
jgi:cytochrome c-type biogenesis protein CcmF